MVPLPYRASFSAEEYDVIKRGLTSQSSDDKWQVGWEDDSLSLHRSWTGFLVYRIQFRPSDGRHEVVQALICDDVTRYRRDSDEYECRFVDWVIRELMLHQNIEMPMPEWIRDLPPEDPDRYHKDGRRSARRWLAAPVAGLAARVLATAAARAAQARRWLKRRWRRLIQSRMPLSDEEVRAIADRYVQANAGRVWYAKIHWVAEPAGAWVVACHPDGPYHDFEADIPLPFFIDRLDGLLVRPKLSDVKRAYGVIARWVKAGVPGARAVQADTWESDPALTDRWVRVWLQGAHPRYSDLSEDA